MPTRTRIVAALLLTAAAMGNWRDVQAAEKGFQKGQRVVVTEQAPLMDEQRTLLTVNSGRILSVGDVKSGWLLVTFSESGKETTGWVEARFVISTSTALARARENTRNAPGDANSWYDLGLLQSLNGDLGRAIDAYGKAIELDPKLPKAYSERGCAYWILGDRVNAVMDFAKARRIESKLPERDRTISVLEAPIQAGDKVVAVDDAPLKDDDRVLLTVPAGRELVASDVKGDWVAVTVRSDGKPVSGWLHAKQLTRAGIGPAVEEDVVLPLLRSASRQAEYVQVVLARHVSGDGVFLLVRECGFDDLNTRQRPAAIWTCLIRDRQCWRETAEFLVEQAAHLVDASDLAAQPTPGGDKTISLLYRFPPQRIFQMAGNTRLVLSAEAQQYLDLRKVSDYPAERNVLIIAEPHFDVRRHVALLKGLEVLLAENPGVTQGGQSVFLAEGYPAGQRLPLAPLIAAEPRPDERLLKSILSTYLIPAYVAYEWKHQHGIPIVGSEDAAIYRICARFHLDNWTKARQSQAEYRNPFETIDAVAQHGVAARNHSIAKTVLAELARHKYTILFVGDGHVGPYGKPLAYSDQYWESFRGVLDAADLQRLKQADRRGIADFLKDAGVGFYLLSARGNPIRDLDVEKEEVGRYFRLFQSQLSGDVESYVRELPWLKDSVTVSPSPQAAAQAVLAKKNAEKRGGDKKGDKGKKNGKDKVHPAEA